METDVELTGILGAVASRWGVDMTGATVIAEGLQASVRLPAVGMVVHVSRAGVSDARAAALQTARARLADAAIPVADLVPARSGRTWDRVHDRVVEVERWVDHDGRMNTWTRLRQGAALLALVHNAWAELDLGTDGEACDWANWISPAAVSANADEACRTLDRWGLDDLARSVHQLAERTATDASLATQVVHGDFWDNNVYVRAERLVAVTDFEFVGRRPRVDDLALLLYFADEQPSFDGVGHRSVRTRMAELTPLVHAYRTHLTTPLTAAELVALPYALARQPMWTFAKWMLTDPNPEHARRDAVSTAPAVHRALQVLEDPEAWSSSFASGERGQG